MLANPAFGYRTRGHGAGLTVATLVQRLLHAAYRTSARQYPYPGPLGRRAESLHDIMAKKVSQQYQQLGPRRQLQGFLLMRRVAPANMLPDGNIVPL